MYTGDIAHVWHIIELLSYAKTCLKVFSFTLPLWHMPKKVWFARLITKVVYSQIGEHTRLQGGKINMITGCCPLFIGIPQWFFPSRSLKAHSTHTHTQHTRTPLQHCLNNSKLNFRTHLLLLLCHRPYILPGGHNILSKITLNAAHGYKELRITSARMTCTNAIRSYRLLHTIVGQHR